MIAIEALASADVQDFIFRREYTDASELVLRKKEILGLPAAVIAGQIKARNKSQYKIPTYFKTRGIVYPPTLNLEQSSSEATAKLKAKLVSGWLTTRQTMVDLTGGFGIDSNFLSSEFERITHVEPNEDLLGLAAHNHRLLGRTNINYFQGTASQFLESTSDRVDLIFIDPSRRDQHQRKIFRLSDCEPNVTELYQTISSRTKTLFIKVSPLMDIQQGLREIPNVRHVVVTSVDNDCKELLFWSERGFVGEPTIHCYHLFNSDASDRDPVFHFKLEDERNTTEDYSEPLRYLFEPNPSVMKAGAFRIIAKRFGLFKLQANTHLYTSSGSVDAFPGRVFEVHGFVKPDRDLRRAFPQQQANILLRNYPMTVEELKKRTGLSEGGERYLIGFTGVSTKWLVQATRVK